eukprot:5706385-Heterocapsa_arctica.AAC.1
MAAGMAWRLRLISVRSAPAAQSRRANPRCPSCATSLMAVSPSGPALVVGSSLAGQTRPL